MASSPPSSSSSSGRKVITKKQLASHTGGDEPWLVVDGKVFDLTNFVEEHPGGADAIFDFLRSRPPATDAGSVFRGAKWSPTHSSHKHSSYAEDILFQYYLGDLEAGGTKTSETSVHQDGVESKQQPGVPVIKLEGRATANLNVAAPAFPMLGGPQRIGSAGTPRAKVALDQGHSALDWGKLKSSGKNLRGVDEITKITPAELRKHNKVDDAWCAINGKVFNITPYLKFHPGGVKDLMRGAGKDCSRLFRGTMLRCY